MATKIRGTRFYIGTTAATASTDTYEEIGNCKMGGGTFGVTWSEIDTTVLTDTYKQGAKGIGDAGSIELTGQYDHADDGQADLKAAALADDDTPYNLKVALTNARNVFVKVRVMSFTTALGNNTNVREFKAMCKVTDAFAEAAAA